MTNLFAEKPYRKKKITDWVGLSIVIGLLVLCLIPTIYIILWIRKKKNDLYTQRIEERYISFDDEKAAREKERRRKEMLRKKLVGSVLSSASGRY